MSVCQATTPPVRVPEVLLVEDNETDRFLTECALGGIGFKINLHVVEDGDLCMHFLRKEWEFRDKPTPDLVLLDLNLPRMDGRQVMAQIVEDSALRNLPVVVLTTSDSERDRSDMYDLRCSTYVAKPVDFNAFNDKIRHIFEYWFCVAALPPR